MAKKAPLITIGRLELVSLPELNDITFAAKVDTGAHTAALHCHHIQTHTANGVEMVSFSIGRSTARPAQNQLLTLPLHRIKRIRSSNGVSQLRCIVRLTLVMGPYRFLTEFSLTDRSRMQYPVLLGRKALRKRFLVDVSKTYLLTSDPKRSL